MGQSAEFLCNPDTLLCIALLWIFSNVLTSLWLILSHHNFGAFQNFMGSISSHKSKKWSTHFFLKINFEYTQCLCQLCASPKNSKQEILYNVLKNKLGIRGRVHTRNCLFPIDALILLALSCTYVKVLFFLSSMPF